MHEKIITRKSSKKKLNNYLRGQISIFESNNGEKVFRGNYLGI